MSHSDPVPSVEPTDPITGLLQLYLELDARGRAPAPEEFASRYPDHREALVEALKDLGLVKDMLARMPEQGERIGRFQLKGVIGTGSMATVYRAYDSKLERNVALKVFHPILKDNEARLERTLTEARALACVDHPHVVKIFDVGQEDDHHYLCLELCEGVDLRAQLSQADHLAPHEVTRLGRQLASALAAVHAQGLVHRDVKPGNVFIRKDGSVTLLDFSIVSSPQGDPFSNRESPIGTPSYMAPEQRAGQDVDARSDVYALGRVLYRCLIGPHPLQNEAKDAQTRDESGRATPPLPRHVPRSLAAIVVKATNPKPEDRFCSAAEMEEALAAEERRRSVRAKRWMVTAVALTTLLVIGFSFAFNPFSAAASSSLIVDVQWYVMRGGQQGAGSLTEIESNGTICSGDWMFVQVQVAPSAWVYVMYETAEGDFVRLFPHERNSYINPIAAGQAQMLPKAPPAPSLRINLFNPYWCVDDQTGQEILWVYVSAHRFDLLESLPSYDAAATERDATLEAKARALFRGFDPAPPTKEDGSAENVTESIKDSFRPENLIKTLLHHVAPGK